MKILTFDTSLDKTYISLCEDANILTVKTIKSSDEKYHSAFLVPTIVEILQENKITMQDISAIGTNVGPGSFTGIRVCNTIARVFAQQLEAKLVGVSSLQILSKINDTDKETLILTDARKNKVYCGIFSKDSDVIESPTLLPKEEAIELAKKDYFVITDSSINQYLKENGVESLNYEAKDYPLGKYLAELTFKMIQNGNEDFNWAKLKPLYIQPPSISKPKAV